MMASASLLSTDGAPIRGTLRRWGPLTLCMFSCMIIVDDLPRSTLTYHTRILRENGITFTRSQGRSCLISLRARDLNDRFPGLLDSVLAGLAADVSREDSAS